MRDLSTPVGRLLSSHFRSSCWFPAVLVALFGWSVAFADGTQTGVLSGAVRDVEGAPFPGVEVTAVGPQTRRTVTTDAEGRFRFPSLEIGRYDVTAELLGLRAEKMAQSVYIDKTTEVALVLVEGQAEAGSQIEEQIEVIALAPLINRFDTRVGAEVGRELLDELPVERFYQSVALLLPGVAGGEDGNPNVSGALRSSNLSLVDGVDTTDPTTGLFGLNLTYEAIDEVSVVTAGLSAEFGRASGAVVNVVTRSGDNSFEGRVRWIASNNDWNSDLDPSLADAAEELRPELEVANQGADDLNSTFAGSLAGPLWEDHLWFFVAYENIDDSFLRPTLEGTLWDESPTVESESLKVSWQLGDRHSLVAQRTADSADFGIYSPFNRAPAENRASRAPRAFRGGFLALVPGDIFAIQEQSQEGSFDKLQWNGVLDQTLSVSLSLAQQDRRIERRQLNSRGLTADAPHVVFPIFVDPDTGGEAFEVTLYNGITDSGFEDRPRKQANLVVDWFLGGRAGQELRAGLDYQETDSETLLNFPGRSGADRATGRPVDGQLFLDNDFRDECFFLNQCQAFDPATGEFQADTLLNFWRRPARGTTSESWAVYATDELALDRWFFSLGLRFDHTEAKDFDGRKLTDDDALGGRLAFKYDPKGDGKALLSASYSRFYEPFQQQFLDTFTRDLEFSGYSEYFWAFDPFGDFDPDLEDFCRGLDPSDFSSPCWFFAGEVPFFAEQPSTPNPDLDRAYVDEVVLAFERQLTDTTAVSLSYIDRQWKDLWDDLFGVNLPDPDASVLRNLDIAERSYRAFQLLVQRRFSGRWQLLGSYTWSEAEGNLFRRDGLAIFADFLDVSNVNVDNYDGLAPFDRTHQVKVLGSYRIPTKWADWSLGSVVRYESGTPYERTEFADFGVRFLTPRGALRLSDIVQWDLSAGASFPFLENLELEVKLEAFNLTNEQTIVNVESAVDEGRFGRPTSLDDVQRPRSYRFTLGLRF